MKSYVFLLLIPVVTLLSPGAHSGCVDGVTSGSEQKSFSDILSNDHRHVLQRQEGPYYAVIKEALTGKIVAHLKKQFADNVTFVVSNDGTRAVIKSDRFYDPKLNFQSGPGTRIMDLTSGELIESQANDDGGMKREFSANGKVVARFPMKNWLYIYEVPSGKKVFEESGFLNRYQSVTLSPAGNFAVVDSAFSRRVIDLSKGEATFSLDSGTSAFSASGKILVNIVSRYSLNKQDLKKVQIIDSATGTLLMETAFPESADSLVAAPGPSIFFSPDEQKIVVEFGAFDQRGSLLINRVSKTALHTENIGFGSFSLDSKQVAFHAGLYARVYDAEKVKYLMQQHLIANDPYGEGSNKYLPYRIRSAMIIEGNLVLDFGGDPAPAKMPIPREPEVFVEY